VFDISPVQIIIVLAIALLVFGPKRLPEMGRSIGRGIRDFKDGLTNDTRDEAPDDPSARTAIAAETAEGEPSLEEIVKENAAPEPVRDEAPPLAGSRS
jgi:sec-independent protein translocase protein TatA